MRLDAEQAITQINQLLVEWERLTAQSKYDDLSDLQLADLQALKTRAAGAIRRWSNEIGPYVADARSADMFSLVASVPIHMGVLTAMKADIEAGWLTTVSELLHADTFSDLLEMSEELLDKGYKDAAAVIAGSILESHLRLMAIKADLEATTTSGKPRSADAINGDLAKADIYNRLQQKQITAWQDLRNSDAHGDYDKYETRDVGRLIEEVRYFLLQFPA